MLMVYFIYISLHGVIRPDDVCFATHGLAIIYHDSIVSMDKSITDD